ncbi:hypothetical protein WJX72_004990 [[Myrmecia] bisecta]|uniref:ER membrane protein complex subunit 7 beta-sandwich domain-containing protein n=1 Tax=[Myrmecia] bisecta TaxID=41462 RepID=A0AAW1R680_9CHLO
MAMCRVASAILLLLPLLLSTYKLAYAANIPRKVHAAAAQPKGITVEGKLVFPPDGPTPAKMKLLLAVDGGQPRAGFPKADGTFVFHDVPPGTHLLDVSVIGLVYPQIRIEAAPSGQVIGTYAEDPLRVVAYPLTIMPTMRAQYFDEQPPFNLMSLLKSPYGLMAAFMLFGIFVLPKMKMDPESEEYKELMSGLSGNKARPALRASGSGNRRD